MNPSRLVECFERYLEHDGLHISRAELEANLHEKLMDPRYGRDIGPLLAPGISWSQSEAAEYILKQITPLLSGEPLKSGS